MFLKNVAVPKSPQTENEIRPCLRDRLPRTKEKLSLTLVVTSEIERTFFLAAGRVTHVCAKLILFLG